MSEEIVKVYSVKEAAGHLHLSEETLRRLVRQKRIAGRKIGGRVFFSAAAINDFLSE
jgi:excisionase family DNA binding protein